MVGIEAASLFASEDQHPIFIVSAKAGMTSPGRGAVRLMCDEMLLRLGRWLRAAGYDTAIVEGGTDDAGLVARCAAEGRVLLTRDRLLAVRAEASVPVLLLADGTVEAQARALTASLGI